MINYRSPTDDLRIDRCYYLRQRRYAGRSKSCVLIESWADDSKDKRRSTSVYNRMRYRPLHIVAFALVLTSCDAYDAWYKRDLTAVQQELKPLPNVSVESVGGSQDDFQLDDIYAELRIGSNGSLHLRQLSPGAFSGEKRFFVSQVGPFFPEIAMYGFQGVRMSETGDPVLTFGTSGAFAIGSNNVALCCSEIRSVRQLVNKYSDVEHEIASWPRCPEYLETTARDGTVYRYCVSLKRDGEVPAVPTSWNPYCR